MSTPVAASAPDLNQTRFIHDVVFKAAYYNAAALSVFFLIGVAVYNNLVIFSAFLQSLAWALLVGVGLHRVKQWLVTHTQDMLIRYSPRTTSAPFFWVLLVQFPWQFILNLLDAGAWQAAAFTHDIMSATYLALPALLPLCAGILAVVWFYESLIEFALNYIPMFMSTPTLVTLRLSTWFQDTPFEAVSFLLLPLLLPLLATCVLVWANVNHRSRIAWICTLILGGQLTIWLAPTLVELTGAPLFSTLVVSGIVLSLIGLHSRFQRTKLFLESLQRAQLATDSPGESSFVPATPVLSPSLRPSLSSMGSSQPVLNLNPTHTSSLFASSTASNTPQNDLSPGFVQRSGRQLSAVFGRVSAAAAKVVSASPIVRVLTHMFSPDQVPNASHVMPSPANSRRNSTISKTSPWVTSRTPSFHSTPASPSRSNSSANVLNTSTQAHSQVPPALILPSPACLIRAATSDVPSSKNIPNTPQQTNTMNLKRTLTTGMRSTQRRHKPHVPTVMVWSSMLETPTASAVQAAAQLSSFSRQLFKPGTNQTMLTPPEDSPNTATAPKSTSILSQTNDLFTTFTPAVQPTTKTPLRFVSPIPLRRHRVFHTDRPSSRTFTQKPHVLRVPTVSSNAPESPAPVITDPVSPWLYPSSQPSLLARFVSFLTRGPASRPYFALLYAVFGVYLAILVTPTAQRALMPQNPELVWFLVMTIIALMTLVFVCNVLARICHLRRRRTVGALTRLLRGMLISETDLESIDLFDERETHDPVLSRTLKHDERVCILAVEAREFATALTDSNNSDADVSDAENDTVAEPSANLYLLCAPLAPLCLRRCFRRVSRLARHSLNILCPQLGFAFSLLCDGYMNVEQWCLDWLHSRTPTLATLVLVTSVAASLVCGSLLFLLQCQRELAHTATLTQMFWREQVADNEHFQSLINATSAQWNHVRSNAFFSHQTHFNESNTTIEPAAWAVAVREWTDQQLQARFGAGITMEVLERQWFLFFDDDEHKKNATLHSRTDAAFNQTAVNSTMQTLNQTVIVEHESLWTRTTRLATKLRRVFSRHNETTSLDSHQLESNDGTLSSIKSLFTSLQNATTSKFSSLLGRKHDANSEHEEHAGSDTHLSSLPFGAIGEYVRGPGVALLSLLFVQLPLATASAVVGASKWVMDAVFAFVVFLSALYLLLISEQAPFDFLRTLIPGAVRPVSTPHGYLTPRTPSRLKHTLDVAHSLSSAVSDVFVSSWKTAHFHFMLTWLCHAAAGSPVQTLPACASALMALLPLLPNFICSVPLAAHLWFWQGRAIAAAVVFGSHLCAYSFVVPAVYSEIEMVDPYITALAIVGGLTAFGLQGALIGPLLVCVLVVGRDALARVLAPQPQTRK